MDSTLPDAVEVPTSSTQSKQGVTTGSGAAGSEHTRKPPVKVDGMLCRCFPVVAWKLLLSLCVKST